MAEPTSRNAGRGRSITQVADTQRPQIPSTLQSAIVTPTQKKPLVPVERASSPPLKAMAPKSEAIAPNPQLKVLQPPTERVTKPLVPSLPVAPAVANPLSPLKVGPSPVTATLQPSVQMTPLKRPDPVTTSPFESGYNPQHLNPAAGEYSYDPEIIVPEHRFLTPSEL